jgi:hypothetical protein
VLWLLQIPAPVSGFVWVALVVGFSVGGLLLFRRAVSHTRLEHASVVSGQVFQLAGVLYAVLVAFLVVVVWEQFGSAQDASAAEASAIVDLLRHSSALPEASRAGVQRSLIAYTEDVVNDEFPRMRRGEKIEEQSEQLTTLWSSYLNVQPESRNEISFFDDDIARLNDLSASRKIRVETGEAAIPGELWVLLLGGGAIVMAFTFLFSTRDLMVHAIAVGLTGALLGFIMYLIFALEHPYVGALSVRPDAYVNVLDIWEQHTLIH